MDGVDGAIARAVNEHAAPHDASTAWLLGVWHVLRCEPPVEIQLGTRMQFSANDDLEYAIPAGDGLLRVTLKWRVDGGILHTAHADGSNPVQVAIAHGEADVLTFDFGGPRAWFVRMLAPD